MRGKETLNIDGVGPVLFESSRKARHMNITVKPFRGVRVAVPYGVPLRIAKAFARAKTDWISKHQGRIREVELERNTHLAHSAEIDWKAARELLTGRLTALSERHGLPYNRLSIRNQKTRWGSCSLKKNISLNVELVTLPEELMDYVLIHELVHTRVHSHGKAFWAKLTGYVPEARLLDAALKNHRILNRSRR